jgi:hypothetical protein
LFPPEENAGDPAFDLALCGAAKRFRHEQATLPRRNLTKPFAFIEAQATKFRPTLVELTLWYRVALQTRNSAPIVAALHHYSAEPAYYFSTSSITRRLG